MSTSKGPHVLFICSNTCGWSIQSQRSASTARTHNSALLIQQPLDLIIETDASLSGWGARCQELCTGVSGQWRNRKCISMYWNSSSFPCNQNFCQGESTLEYSDSNRQHDSQGIYKSPRGYSFLDIELHSNAVVRMVPRSSDSTRGQVSPRGGQQDRRQGIQNDQAPL